MADKAYTPPGRIGNPDMSLASDPRINPKLLAALQAFGMASNQTFELPDNISAGDPNPEKLTPLIKDTEDKMLALYNGLPNDLAKDSSEPEIDTSELTIKGVDDNDIKLYIYKPAKASGPLPAVLYSHGGGMVHIPTDTKAHRRWLQTLACQNLIAIAVDFRNAYASSSNTYNPFPAGLNDCAAAAKYLHANKSSLGISKLITQGESGGGNLAITTALKAKREGWLDAISGVYASVPYISNAYGWPRERKLRDLPSLVENDGYLIACDSLAAYGWYYGPQDVENPHAWPYHESVENLEGLPPVHLSMDELDPLRDEGMVFYRKLAQAGVQVTAEVKLGIIHAAEMILRQALPEAHESAARSIAEFARSV